MKYLLGMITALAIVFSGLLATGPISVHACDEFGGCGGVADSIPPSDGAAWWPYALPAVIPAIAMVGDYYSDTIERAWNAFWGFDTYNFGGGGSW